MSNETWYDKDIKLAKTLMWGMLVLLLSALWYLIYLNEQNRPQHEEMCRTVSLLVNTPQETTYVAKYLHCKY